MVDRIITLEEVAEVTRTPLSTLRYWRASGQEGPPTFRLGRRVVAFEGEVEAWIKAQAAKDPAATR